MEFFEVVKTRQSIRKFTSQLVEREKLEIILDTAVNRAPSSGNRQGYMVYVVSRAEDRQALRKVADDREYITSAPVVLVFCAAPARVVEEYGERGTIYAVQDASIACAFAMLAAVAQGLACVPAGAFDEAGVKRVIDAPEGVIPVLLLPIGYAAEKRERNPRLPMSELVRYLGE